MAFGRVCVSRSGVCVEAGVQERGAHSARTAARAATARRCDKAGSGERRGEWHVRVKRVRTFVDGRVAASGLAVGIMAGVAAHGVATLCVCARAGRERVEAWEASTASAMRRS